jgi:ssRNA-specific RNase YbeY (16S rRNA maturation enzyme)
MDLREVGEKKKEKEEKLAKPTSHYLLHSVHHLSGYE